MKIVQLGDIQIEIDGDPNLNGGSILKGLERDGCPFCDEPWCDGHCNAELSEGTARLIFNGAMDGIESFVLALACEGVDIETPEFRDALKTACDACANNIV